MYARSFVALSLLAACGPPAPPTGRGVVIGSTSVDIDTRKTVTRVGEAPIGDFLADTLLDTVDAMFEPVQVALLNAGSIRGGDTSAASLPVEADAKLGRVYPAGPLTDVDVLGWDPFRDGHVVMTLTGAELKSALERGAAQLPPDMLNEGGGAQLLHVSGARYTIDCAGVVQRLGGGGVAREGTRVSRLEVDGELLFDADGGVDRLDDSRVRVVVNSFLAAGLDGHVALTAGTDRRAIPYEELDLAHAAVARVAMTSPIAPQLDGRITVVGDCGRPLTLP